LPKRRDIIDPIPRDCDKFTVRLQGL